MNIQDKRKEQVETRVSLALKRIGLVGDLAKDYNFEQEEIDRIFDAIEKKVRLEKRRYIKALDCRVSFPKPFKF
jgi:hypothetical protein